LLCFQPFLQYLLVHRDVVQEPLVADPIEARLDIAFEYPLGRAFSAQRPEGLVDGVSRRATDPKTVRVRVGHRLRNRVERQQV